ncbi:tetratricopeptide repeat protein [Geothrix sp. 21YS21S-4]|uniref:tetratricopeptide repeat protein n=1 Tax=Geothrix sp. 21YS21S-4 TaxID=3068889 RepID=UPI0027BA5EA0|nr:tetratricopeptide repeat protein [Geothrix sp. 21YS21S-4]
MGKPAEDRGSLHALLTQAVEDDRAGRTEAAEAGYRAYLAADPGNASAWADLGGLLLMTGRPAEAEGACRQALERAADYVPAKVNLAHALLRLGRGEEAEFFCRGVLAGNPADRDAWIALAEIYRSRRDLARARAALERLRALDPTYGRVDERLADLYFLQRDWDALQALSPPDASDDEIAYARAHWDLRRGRFAEGWAGYELRLRLGRIVQGEALGGAAWKGESFAGKTLLVHWEQGLGDSLMFLRYLPLVKARGGIVLLVVQPQLLDLAATCEGVDLLRPYGAPHPDPDLHVFLMSLPHLLGADEATIPASVPYLRVPETVPNRIALAERLTAAEGKLRVGLVWAGNPLHTKDAERSLPVEVLAPLAALPGVAWFSLQTGREELPSLPGIASLAPLLGTLADTAFALGELDLLITVDTAAAHLAGALGVPTFLLLPFCPDWRWLLDRDDSPWYPSLRLYRQAFPGEWEPVLQQVAAELQAGL